MCKQEAVNNANSNSDDGVEESRRSRKRTFKDSSRSNKKKRRKLNRDEDVDIDSDETNFKDKVFDRYVSDNSVRSNNPNSSFAMLSATRIQI